MKLSRVLATSALVVSVVALSTARVFADTPVDLAGVMDAPVFVYGVRQGFKITGNTKGKKCEFNYLFSLNGTQVGYGVDVNAPLPWTSPDLKLPSSKGGTYSLSAYATNLNSTVCKGGFNLSFAVTPETGKLTALTVSPKIVATNQKISFRVSGKNFGTCRFKGTISRAGIELAHADVDQVPYEYTTAFPDAGDYQGAVDELDDKTGKGTVSEGCTGHLKTTFTVIARPACPVANEYYQSADDGEFGCLYPAQPGDASPSSYACPTGYDKFNSRGTANSSGTQNVQYGCKREGSPLLDYGVVSALVKTTGPLSNLGTLLGSPPPAAADKPTIVGIKTVDSTGKGHAWRPHSDVFYAGEEFRVDVLGNLPNKAGYGNACEYNISAENLATHKVTNLMGYSTFDIHPVGVIPTPGEYRISVVGVTNPALPPACKGKAELAKLKFYRPTAWVTGLKLRGFGFHFNMANAMGMPQFCEACDSIFSPAHDRAFLQIEPTGEGTTAGGQCVYSIVANGGGDNRSFGAGISNGQPVVPANQLKYFPSYELTPPWWNMYNVDKLTVTVTITGGGDAANPDYPSDYPWCHVAGGKISKTITFSSDPKAPKASK